MNLPKIATLILLATASAGVSANWDEQHQCRASVAVTINGHTSVRTESAVLPWARNCATFARDVARRYRDAGAETGPAASSNYRAYTGK